MRRIAILAILLLSVGLVAYAGLIYIDNYSQPWRMRETPAVRPHEAPLLVMEPDSIPIQGGDHISRRMDPLSLENPLPFNEKTIERGKEKYGLYCTFCHGVRGDGQGPVGQSFYPLPRDLGSPQVQEKSDSYIFYTISFGQKRMPALGTTVAEQDRWYIINYLRSLPSKGVEKQ